MGKKKRSDYSEEQIRRKIRKLENDLAAKAVCVNVGASTSQNINVLPSDSLQDEVEFYVPSPPGDETPPERSQSLSPQRSPSPPPRDPSPAPPHSAPSPTPQPVLMQHQTDPSGLAQTSTLDNEQAGTEEKVLEADILELLGDAPKPDSSLGPAIHKDIARRWQDILLKGLPKDVKDKLLKNYLVPANCDLLEPPSLNLEVKAAITEHLIKRDFTLLKRQNQIGIALSALAQVTEMIISNEGSKQKLLKPLSDACRLLCDSHYLETKTRRYFVITSINDEMTDTLSESIRDKFLFGENVTDKLNAAKTIKQSGDSLKKASVIKPRPQRPTISVNLNLLPQHRKTENKPNEARRPIFRNVTSPTFNKGESATIKRHQGPKRNTVVNSSERGIICTRRYN